MTRICKMIQDDMWIEHNQEIIKASIKGVFRIQAVKPMIGDYVNLEWENNHPIITELLPRKNQLVRPSVANIDLVVLVQSSIEPEFNPLLLDKMLLAYAIAGVKVVVALTKTDLQYSDKLKQIVADYKMMHYQIYDINNDAECQQLIASFAHQLICFAGNSGVGKSTFINKLNPLLNIKTQAISKALNRGKHTTTSSTIIACDDFYVVDSPGYSTVNIDISQHMLAHNFFSNSISDSYCKFNDCFHLHPNSGCLVQQYVKNGKISAWRYDNYVEINSTLGDKYDKAKPK